MVTRILLLAALLLCLPLQALTQLTATVDKNPALRGESITLEVQADTRAAADAFNFRVLEQDFTVMVPSVSQSTRIINGNASQSTSWKVVLLPKRSGDFTIPAFSLQGLSTKPIQLQVLDATQAAAGAGASSKSRELFLQSRIDQPQLYVQQLSYYQVTIYFDGELQRGSLSEPQLDGADIQQVGQDSEGTELVNGIRYRTITRRYAITPQRSGNFTIAPPTFSGEMIDRDNARYNYFARTKTVVQQAEAIDITVSPVPEDFPGNWLVAGLVTLNEEWSPDITTLKQGEPVTRTITLSAVDVAENQLPELTQGFPEGLRLYQEQPQAKSAERNGRLVAQKIFTTAVIANKSGELELPEVQLPWWNSQTNQLAMATLPARTLTVEAAANQPVNEITVQPLPDVNLTPAEPDNSNWRWNHISSILLALWLVTLLSAWWLWQRRPASQPAVTTASRVTFNSTKLKQVCQRNDAAQAKAELLRFAHQQLDQRCSSLSEIAALPGFAGLKPELEQLNAALYANSDSSWQGADFWQKWLQHQPSAANSKQASTLSPLYPT
ncbi:protein BatD [Rheinheimera sp. YQF-2]|uniref:Protein BatD n=1 Tax=Rheinheimera lutimaris TaxID=2740584 RepID=A0A7Y5EH25_9GAMM|nr:BatD family protein [Rheinheimera lutimaris]NRQ41984.1 protein BatD [Rheinheimera lutimaris]